MLFFFVFVTVMYRVFNYFKHHVFYVSINNFLEQHVYKQHVVYVLDFGLSYFWHIIEYLEVS